MDLPSLLAMSVELAWKSVYDLQPLPDAYVIVAVTSPDVVVPPVEVSLIDSPGQICRAKTNVDVGPTTEIEPADGVSTRTSSSLKPVATRPVSVAGIGFAFVVMLNGIVFCT